MNIVAILGNESHTTSRGWSKLSINGKEANWRNAVSKNWLTKWGDKHARWCECVFEVKDGDRITWEAGANSGSRGSDRKRENLILIADSSADIFQNDGVGYDATIKGRMRLEKDINKAATDAHAELLNNL
jgi:hypothetical protein